MFSNSRGSGQRRGHRRLCGAAWGRGPFRSPVTRLDRGRDAEAHVAKTHPVHRRTTGDPHFQGQETRTQGHNRPGTRHAINDGEITIEMQRKLDDLERRRKAAREMGGTEKIERQHGRGKLTVRERVDLLFDEGSFEEYGLLANHLGHRPGDKSTPADGVITGFGRIDGRHAGVIAEDFTVLGGSTGFVNFTKRVRMIEIATRERASLVWLLDGSGARAQELAVAPEGVPPVSHFVKMARLSGVAPQVAVVMGACAGEPALEAALTEFVIMVKHTGMLAAGGPPVVFTSLGIKVTKEELGGLDVHCRISGVADNPAEDDEDALRIAKRYLSYS